MTRATGHTLKAINAFGGKLIGEMYLISTEDVNGVMRTRAKY
jgi:hypothetical protein